MKFWKRNSIISKKLYDKDIYIHNGITFIKKRICNRSIGYKIGEFSDTRQKAFHAGKERQNKKVSRMGGGVSGRKIKKVDVKPFPKGLVKGKTKKEMKMIINKTRRR